MKNTTTAAVAAFFLAFANGLLGASVTHIGVVLLVATIGGIVLFVALECDKA